MLTDNMSWFYLALLAPLLYAVVNLIDDNMLQYVYDGPKVATAAAGIMSSAPLITLSFLHFGTISHQLASMAILAGILTTSYFYFYFKALDVEQPSVVIALFSLVPATLPFIAHFLLNEHLGGMEVLGFLIVLLASFGIAATDIKKFKFSSAMIPVFIAVIFLDIISLLTKHVYDHASFYPAYMCFVAGMGIAGLSFLIYLLATQSSSKGKRLKFSVRKVLPFFIVAEGTYLLAEFTLNLAISRGSVSIVRVIEGVQPMYVLLIALIMEPFAPRFFREAKGGNLPKKFALMIILVIGLILINVAIKGY